MAAGKTQQLIELLSVQMDQQRLQMEQQSKQMELQKQHMEQQERLHQEFQRRETTITVPRLRGTKCSDARKLNLLSCPKPKATLMPET